jgi:hypothetical protein
VTFSSTNTFTFRFKIHNTSIRRTSGRILGPFEQSDALSPPKQKVTLTPPFSFPFFHFAIILYVSVFCHLSVQDERRNVSAVTKSANFALPDTEPQNVSWRRRCSQYFPQYLINISGRVNTHAKLRNSGERTKEM